MARIAAESEESIRTQGFPGPAARAGTRAARRFWRTPPTARREESGAAAIVVFTSTGSSARLVSRYRPPVGIYAITPHDTTARQLAVNYGVTPILAPDVSSTDEMLALMDRLMVEGGYLKQGELVVFVAGQPIGRPGTTNLMKLHRVRTVRRDRDYVEWDKRVRDKGLIVTGASGIGAAGRGWPRRRVPAW